MTGFPPGHHLASRPVRTGPTPRDPHHPTP